MKYLYFPLILILIFTNFNCFAQQDTSKKAGMPEVQIDSTKQRDAIDLLKELFKKNSSDFRKKPSRFNFSLVPAFGYSLSTGFAVDLVGNVAFYTSHSPQENLSAMDAELVVDTKGQRLLVSRSEIWADKNSYKLVTDLRLEKYPTDSYGLGTTANNSKDDPIVYSYTRAYVTLYKKITSDFYGGVGYNFDHYYNIKETGLANGGITGYQQYGGGTFSTSSGVTANLLFDNRRNKINPLNGGYALISYRENPTFLGGTTKWQELQMDFRKYFRTSAKNNDILAFWAMAQFTSGNVPYFDLPATGQDMYNNAGRGYQEQRFRGKNMLYLESEYRFGITKNGLLGGVLFASGESLSEFQNNRFVKIAPAGGTGLRIKINKHSDTNVCIDYAFGLYGSRGLFVNLGEVF